MGRFQANSLWSTKYIYASKGHAWVFKRIALFFKINSKCNEYRLLLVATALEFLYS